jgi:hypothetical protein
MRKLGYFHAAALSAFFALAAAPLWSLESVGIFERDARGFDVLSFETAGTLALVQGDEEYLRIEAPANVAERITTEVRGGTLRIGYRGIFTARSSLPLITVGIKNVRAIRAASSGSIESSSIVAGNLAIEALSSGSIAIGSLKAGAARIRIDSSGSVELRGCALGSIDARLASSGNLAMSGEAERLDLACSSSGGFEGAGLRLSGAAVALDSSGSAVIWVLRRLEAKVAGKGELSYYGRPELAGSAATPSRKLRSLGDK